MLARYVTVWKLDGATTLVNEQQRIVLGSSSEPRITATIAVDPDPYLLHADRTLALASQLFKGGFASKNKGSLEERLATEIEGIKARRAKRIGPGIFIVFEGEMHVAASEFRNRFDAREFTICLDEIDNSVISATFRPFVDTTLAALALSLALNANRQFEKIGTAIYLVNPESEKPIYSLTISMGSVQISVASPLDADVISAARSRISLLMMDNAMSRPVSLMNASFNKETDALQGFIAAWSALEIFVNASFKAIYEPRWFDIMEGEAPAASKPVFGRFKDVMRDKYRLADKFLIIAAVLDSDTATADAKEFQDLKTVRDSLLHALETPAHLPTEAVQKLLINYMRRHLDRRE